MADDRGTPSTATLYVGTMLAFMTMRSLSINLAQQFAAAEVDVPKAILETQAGREVEWPDYEGVIRKMIAKAMETLDAGETVTDVTDLEPGDYDRELALEVALDTVQRAIELVTTAAFSK